MSWAAEKAQWFIPIGSWFLCRWYCFFYYYVYFDKDILLRRKSSISPTNNDKPVYAVKTDFVSQVYIICTKIHDKNNNTIGAKTRSLWKWIFVLFLLQKRFGVNCRTRQNATWQFITHHWKFTFSYSFWSLEVAIIGRTTDNYNG